MTDIVREDRQTVYEIGYLIVPSVPGEKLEAEVEAVKKIIAGAGSAVIAEGAPYKDQLAYTMRKKSVSGSYEKYDEAYFGWIKFEVGASMIEAIKKAISVHPTVLRMLLITTVRDNTYLGKRSGSLVEAKPEEAKVVSPVSVEEMDKSIDAMVKEV